MSDALGAYAIEETRQWEAELGRDLGAGDSVEVDAAALPDHGVTVRLVADAILLDHGLIPQVLATPQLIPSLREWMRLRSPVPE